MSVKSYKKIGADRVTTKVQDNVQLALTPLLKSKVLDGILLQGIELSSGANVVSHRLGRKLSGWLIIRKRANASIWDEQDVNTTPELTLKLQSSGAVTVDLWVF